MNVRKTRYARAFAFATQVFMSCCSVAHQCQDDLLRNHGARLGQPENRQAAVAKQAGAIASCPAAAAEPATAPRTVALVVQDHSHGGPVDILALTDELTAQLASNGFRVVNPYNSLGVNQNRTPAGERTPGVSAMELARKFRAQGALTATVTDFGQKTSGIAGVGSFRRFSIRMSFSLADAWTGAAVCGERIKAESKNYTDRQISENGREYVKDLIFDTAAKCAGELKRKASGWRPAPPPPPPAPPKPVDVFFGCNVLGADIQIDGLSYGTCPAQISVAPGPHDIVVSYPPYYFPFKRRAMLIGNGQTFAVVLQTTPEGEKVRRSGILFNRQKELFDAEMSRYKASGEIEDYVRKTIADGTSIYWKNSYGRIVITDGTAENISFTTPATDAADLQDAPTTGQIGKKLKELLEEPKTAK